MTQLVNRVGWEVQCCDGPVELIQQVTYAKTEGKAMSRCPTCKTQWMMTAFWRPAHSASAAKSRAASPTRTRPGLGAA